MRLLAKIMLFMLMVGFIPLMLMSVSSFTAVEGSIRNAAHNTLLSLANEIGKEVTRTVNEGFLNILLLAENPVMRSAITSRQEKKTELIKIHKYHRIFRDISLLDHSGEIITSVLHSFRGEWKSTTWFQSALAGESTISNVHGVLYPFDIVMTVATVVKDKNDNLTGVLVGQLDMERVWQITRNVSLGNGCEVLIVDAHGIVVAAPDSDRLLEPIDNAIIRAAAIKKQTGVTTFKENAADKVAVYVPFQRLPDNKHLNWCAVVIQPKKDLYSPVFHARKSLLIASSISFFAIILLSFLLSGKISSRVRKLVGATQSLGKGDFSKKLGDFGKDEIGELAATFNWASQRLADVYERNQQAKAALKKAHDELEIRVQARTAQLSESNKKLKKEIKERKQAEAQSLRAKEEAEIANQAKSEFLANMSHELRTPMNHIIGFTELILDKSFGDLNDIQTEYLTDVHTSSNHLLSLINDILDLSKVEAGKIDLSPSCVDIKALLETSLIMIKEKAMKQKIKLSTNINSIPATITADERRIKQIMYNLLSNAVKFTPDGGSVSVSAHTCGLDKAKSAGADNDQSLGIKISISDSGIGLNPEDLDRIFNPFEQVESSRSRKFQGTGLGLSLTKSLVGLHGGKIWAESKGEGLGATFSFTLPVTPEDSPSDSETQIKRKEKDYFSQRG